MFDVRLELGSLEVRPIDPLSVTGNVWAEVGGRSFPAPEWSDTVLSVIGSLGAAIRSARSGETADFYFFDGPYFVKLTPEAEQVRVSGVCDRLHLLGEADGGVVEAETVVSLSEVADTYVRCVQDLRTWAEEHGHAGVNELLSRKYTL